MYVINRNAQINKIVQHQYTCLFKIIMTKFCFSIEQIAKCITEFFKCNFNFLNFLILSLFNSQFLNLKVITKNSTL